jgi:hypothetical protein
MRAARACDALLVLVRAIYGALVHPVCQSVVGPEISNQARDVITPMPIAPRALDAKDIKHSDQTAYRSVEGHSGYADT